jgi:hypothetical protein
VGIVPYALTHEPILTLNVVDAMLWVSGTACMRSRTTDAVGVAAFVAGLLSAFMPQHPLTARYRRSSETNGRRSRCCSRTIVLRGRWTDAAALALFVGLQMLESFIRLRRWRSSASLRPAAARPATAAPARGAPEASRSQRSSR